MCDVGDVYDLVIILLLLLFDRDWFCDNFRCKKKSIHVARFILFLIITTVEWVVISQTNEAVTGELENFAKQVEKNETGDSRRASLLFTAIGVTIITAVVASAFIYYSVCKKAEANTLLKFIIFVHFEMILVDIFMLVFTILYAADTGAGVVNFENFAEGFRSVVFILSIFDIIHSFIGFVSVLINRGAIYNELSD